MNNCIAVCAIGVKCLELPSIELSKVPAKLSKRLWIEPQAMGEHVQALSLAEWAIATSHRQRVLPPVPGRGRKTISPFRFSTSSVPSCRQAL
jgi:hypothetical protein